MNAHALFGLSGIGYCASSLVLSTYLDVWE